MATEKADSSIPGSFRADLTEHSARPETYKSYSINFIARPGLTESRPGVNAIIVSPSSKKLAVFPVSDLCTGMKAYSGTHAENIPVVHLRCLDDI